LEHSLPGRTCPAAAAARRASNIFASGANKFTGPSNVAAQVEIQSKS